MKTLFSLLVVLLCSASIHAQGIANDHQARAKAITSFPYTETLDIATATKETDETFDEACGTGSEKTAWWKLQARQSGFLRIDTKGSPFDTVVDVYKNNERLSCNDDSPAEDDDTASQVLLEVEAGQTYLIRVYAYNDEQENYEVHLNVDLLTPSVHTTLNNPKVNAEYPADLEFLVGANSNEPSEAKPSCAGTEDRNSVWVKLTQVTDGILLMNTIGSELDTNLSLWKGTKHPLTEVACNEDSGERGVSQIATEVSAGQVYYVRIAGFEGKTGLAHLNLKIAEKVDNDAYAAAKEIRNFPYEDSAMVEGATLEEEEQHASCSPEDTNSIWYKLVPTRSGTLIVSTADSDYDSVVSLWRASGFSINEVACNDDANETVSYLAVAVEANKPYYLRVSSTNAQSVGSLKLKVDFGTSPAHDSLADAQVLERLPFQGRVDVSNGSTEKDEMPACGFAPNTVWLKYTPEKDGLLVVSADKNDEVPPVIAVYAGTEHPLTSKGCVSQNMATMMEGDGFEPPIMEENLEPVPQDAPSEVEGEGVEIEMDEAIAEPIGYKPPYQAAAVEYPQINTYVEGGKTYFISVSSEGAVSGTVNLKVENQKIWKNASPERAQQINLNNLPQKIEVQLQGSSYSGESLPSCGSSFYSPHWYKLTPEASTVLKINTVGSDFDSVVAIWQSGSESILENQVICNDDENTESEIKTSKLTTVLKGGETYYLLVGAYDVNGGNLVMNLEKGEISARADLKRAPVISSLPFEESVSADEIGVMQPEEVTPSCGTDVINPIWWRLDSSISGNVQISTIGSTYDTVLSLWEGESHPLVEVGCNDDDTQGQSSLLHANLEAGKTYFIRVGGFSMAMGTTQLLVETFAPPANDDKANAEVISTVPFEVEATTKGASAEADETASSCAESAANSLWWKYIATATQTVQFKLEPTEFDGVMSIHGSDTESACADKGGVGEKEALTLNAKAGETYWVRVASYTGVGGSFKLDARVLIPIENDSYRAATPIRTLPFSATLDNSAATGEEKEIVPDCGSEDSNSLWWKYTATASRELTIHTTESDFDTIVSVWTGTIHPLTQVACNDDDEGLQSKLTLSAEAGKTYYIRVSGVRSSTGNLKISVE